MDDTTRRVSRGDDMAGRGDDVVGRTDETTRNYAKTKSSDDAELDPETSRRTREIQSEIAHTRAEMSETIEAIQEKLRPSNLVSDATERVKTATTEKVKNMADTASETAQDVMRETRERAYDVVESAKQNPIPALMIGAGIAWLLIDRTRNKGNDNQRRDWSQYSAARDLGYETTNYRGASAPRYSDVDYNRDEFAAGGTGYGSTGATGSTGSTGSTGYQSASTYRGSSDYRGSSGSGGTMDSVRDLGERTRMTARRTQSQLQRTMRDNPLLVGAAAVLIGAAVGASLPETERENELMGSARDSMVDRAQEAARDAASTVREVAGEAVEKVTDKVGGDKGGANTGGTGTP